MYLSISNRKKITVHQLMFYSLELNQEELVNQFEYGNLTVNIRWKTPLILFFKWASIIHSIKQSTYFKLTHLS